MKIVKIILIILLVFAISAAAFIYLNRQSIFDQSINTLLKRLMPPYIEVESIDFDFDRSKISVKKFKVLNPRGYHNPYLIEIPEIKASYGQRNKQNILEGLSIKDIELIRPMLYVERLSNSEINIQRMDEVFKQPRIAKKPGIGSKVLAIFSYALSPVKDISRFLELAPIFNVRSGGFVFNDFYVDSEGYKTSIDEVEAEVELVLQKGFKGVDYVRSEGSGLVNGKRAQMLHWVTEYDPTCTKLTMANRFKIRGVEFVHFWPYYDKFSPFIFEDGRASGELVFNFDNGDIGSMNEIRLSHLKVKVKESYAYGDFWAVSIEDLYKYFSSEQGEIIFDFKIKGPMDKPKFYLGSKTKRALARMAVDKIADRLLKKEGDDPAQSGSAPSQQGEKSDLEKVLDIFKNIKDSD